ncbi:MAG: protease inhibitor I42 family protein [Candidatus Margulisbacteria bacterium]|nr:protease inhibitor I42 family protein [Candidatus Margulisiibacteriota bacterium]MBU1021132.1 protease inhibitor I42 family protein [Candidatus Margulisiibacteriota bacterium]MBU1728687.1 protease inhibitor I42 family protein [Candidatus Margulisiibacteriota bacterium]MBU1955138.1 protease inhibitor I42 family protein [Candidatus Margulisiibacteriota bacterium]
MRKIFLLTGLLVFTLLMVSCVVSKTQLFNQDDNGGGFTVEVNKVFKVTLPANPTTGYGWYFNKLDTEAFKVVESGYNSESDSRVGAGGNSWWKIKTLAKGEKTLSLLYYRSWEGPQKAVNQYEITLIIK